MSQDTINSVAKAFEVIRVMSRQPRWELGEICRATGFPKTTVFRIVLTLEEQGVVVQERKGGTYQLSLELFKIGSSIVSHFDLVDLARPACRALLQAIDETVNLTVPSGLDMLVVDKYVTTQILRPDSVIGTSFPIYRSASGKVYLAYLPESERNEFLQRIKTDTAGVTTKDLEMFSSEFESVRKYGFGYDNEEIYLGVRCIAAPIFDHSGQVVATLSCSIPSIRMNDNSEQLFFSEVVRAAVQISRTLRAPENILRRSG